MSTKLNTTRSKLKTLSFESLYILYATEKITAATTGNTPSKKEENPGTFLELR